MAYQSFEGYGQANLHSGGLSVRADYLCLGCMTLHRYFLLKVDPGFKAVMKVGQEPVWTFAVPKELAKGLGNQAETYRKGLISESQGYGIGVFAYYRRIVGETINELLDDIGGLIHSAEHQQYKTALP